MSPPPRPQSRRIEMSPESSPSYDIRDHDLHIQDVIILGVHLVGGRAVEAVFLNWGISLQLFIYFFLGGQIQDMI